MSETPVTVSVCVASVEAEIRDKPNPSQDAWLEREPTGNGWFRCSTHGIEVYDRMAEVLRLAQQHRLVQAHDVQRLTVRPGDRLLVTAPTHASLAEFALLRSELEAAFPDARIAIVPSGVTAAVVEISHTDADLIRALDRADRIRGRHALPADVIGR